MLKINSAITITLLLIVSSMTSPTLLAAEHYIVRFAQAELDSTAGMQGVYRRIEKAAREYCPSYRQIRSHADVRSCVKAVVDDLVQKTQSEAFIKYAAGQQQAKDVQFAHSSKDPNPRMEAAARIAKK